MLQIEILAVGKIKESYIKEGIKEYSKRLGSYVRLTMREVDDEPCPDNASAAEEVIIKRKEGERLLKGLTAQDYVIVLDLKGRELSSPGLADFLEERALSGHSKITFIIGGSLGLAEDVLKRADFRWTFSKLTFPHQLIRLILLEQIYRACKINKKETYHK